MAVAYAAYTVPVSTSAFGNSRVWTRLITITRLWSKTPTTPSQPRVIAQLLEVPVPRPRGSLMCLSTPREIAMNLQADLVSSRERVPWPGNIPPAPAGPAHSYSYWYGDLQFLTDLFVAQAAFTAAHHLEDSQAAFQRIGRNPASTSKPGAVEWDALRSFSIPGPWPLSIVRALEP